MVDLTSASWNQVGQWLRLVAETREAQAAVRQGSGEARM
jgi:hypothetical protein